MNKLHTFLILSGLMVMVSSASAAESITAEKVYMYAKTKNTTALKLLNEKIDVVDSNGNTALCLSMLKQDKNAYDMLKEAGANPYADCVNKIGMASGDEATTSTPASNGTFLGMGTVGWSITGAVVAGGAVAAAAGGGGGGGGSSSGSSTSDNSESNEKPTITCVNGSVSGNKCVCKDGWTGSTCATAKTCTYNTTSCNGGYEETRNTCKSGNITYKECKAKSVPSGYTKNTCGNGYTQVDTFLSGTDTYYKCEANSCSGYVMSCGTGYHTTSDICLSGVTTMYKCEINDCSAYQASCGNGYDKTESCVSGATPYYTCTPKAIPTGYTKTACGEGYTQVDTFLSGNDTYYKCEAKAVPSGYTENSCGNGYEQKDTFISGIKTYYLCEVNSCDGYVTSCEDGYHTTSDICQSGETTMYKCEANVCTTGSTSDSCPEGHHAELTGEYSGNQQCFVCVEDGVALDCGTHGTANGDVCQCDSGYAGTFCNLPDENHIIGTDGNLYEKLSCQNSGTQVNASCSCPDGWEGQYCQTAKTCSGYEESCAQGYHTTTDTCQSGNNTMYKCVVNDCSAYQAACSEGYTPTESCVSGTTPYYTCTPKDVPAEYNQTSPCGTGYDQAEFLSGTDTYYKCTPKTVPNGYTKDSCGEGYTLVDTFVSGTDTYYKCEINKCEGYATSCENGYHATSDTCQSGNTTMYKCEINDCSAYQTSCSEGYNAVQSCISGTTPYYTCTPKDVPEGYTANQCGDGYTQIDTFVSGNDTYYKCEANDCSAYQTDCGEGYNKTESCLSGATQYYTCTPKDVPEGYTKNSCGEGYTQVATFLSGTDTYYKCEADSCEGFNYTECPTGYAQSDSCQAGATTKFKCTEIIADNSDEIIIKTLNENDLIVHVDADGEQDVVAVNNSDINAEVNAAKYVVGVDAPKNYIVNAADNGDNKNITIDLTQHGNGSVYGVRHIFSDENTTPDDSDEYLNMVNANTSQGYQIIGNIKINDYSEYKKEENQSNNNIYGMYSNANYMDIYNVGSSDTANVNSLATGLITINNNSDKNVYGIYSQHDAINSESDANGKSIARIDISTIGNGDIYGIYGLDNVYNAIAYKHGNLKSSEAIGVINIQNESSDTKITNIYGLKSGNLAQNAVNSGGKNASGLVRIGNFGNNNAYGIFGKTIDNAVVSGKVSGTINIINDNGNAYGLYSDIHGNTIRNDAHITVSSIIEMANIGNGLAVGIYSKDGTISNSGNITIHNLDSGTAVGIYADGSTNVNNTGNITINRSDYVDNKATEDESDDITYTAKSLEGGKAIGIYGDSNSNIYNIGTIKIDETNMAYGIFSEGGNVENHGVIRINGEFTENAIHLNGGQLLQNGLLEVNGNWCVHGTMNGNSCVCEDGWEGQYCQTAKTCSGYSENCAQGYHQTTDTCQSGEITMYKCEINVCLGYTTNCGTGYHSTSDTCQSGATTMYKCEINDCSSYQISCGEGYNSQESCVSGSTPYYTCTPKDVPEGYTKAACGEGYTQVGTFLSGTDTYYKCEANTCEGFNYTECPTGYAQSDSCQSGNTTKLKCGNCAEGYVQSDGQCYTELHCDSHARQVKNACICNIGYIMIDGTCRYVKLKEESINNNTLIVENNEDVDVLGMYNSSYSMINAKSQADGIINIIKHGNGNVYGMYSNQTLTNATDRATGEIVISKNGDGDVYGMYGSQTLTNATDRATGEIVVSKDGNGNVYGMYGSGNLTNATGKANAKINISNTGEGNIYGMRGGIVINATDTATGKIDIVNYGNGNVYGISGGTAENSYSYFTSANENEGVIKILNYGNGNVYGVNGTSVYNVLHMNNKDQDVFNSASGRISISNQGNGNAYGIYGGGTNVVCNAHGFDKENPRGTARGFITMVNQGIGNTYGLYGSNSVNNHNEGYYIRSTIEMANTDNGLVIGLYGKKGAKNSGDIIIHNLGDGTAVGIYAEKSSEVENSGNITINRTDFIDDMTTYDTSDDVVYSAETSKGGMAIGIYGASGSTINNTESGTITINGAKTAYGIYAESGATVNNNGTITINGKTNSANRIVLNGGTLFQNGVLTATNNTQNSPMSVASVKPASLNLNDFGGTVVASNTSQFVVEGAISGDLTMNNSIIENGFDTTYSVKDMIQAGDTSELNLVSQSALFDATLQNNTDAVMTMKAFNDVVEGSSVADFLQNNYAEGNNEKLFSTLKSAASIAELNSSIDDLFGKDMLSRMAFEDLSMLREVSLDMNNHLFKQEGAFAFGGNVSPSSYDNNIGSIGRYSLNGYNNGKMSFGVGVSITDVRTDDGHSDNRRFDRNFMMSAPIGYKTHGFELITAPKMGYADGNYDRDGFNNMTYDGKVQKRMFALMNEARYPVKFGGIKLIPSAEFNVIGYNIKGHEDDKEYSLRIKSQNHYSVEAGFGLMAEKEFKPFKNHKFNINGGVAVYHEFANPYELDVAMNGMSGTYRLQDEKRSDNRAVVRFGFGYELKDNIDVSASWLTNIDREYRTDASIDMKYHF